MSVTDSAGHNATSGVTETEGALVFPTGFIWGTATASYQVEGAVDEDGRGPSIWDTFSAEPGKVLGGDTGAQACDHYHRYPEDVALVKSLGLDVYRFSVAWPRVLPDGRTLESRGLDFYDRLVDEVLAAGIDPMLTLYHWDLPQALQDMGGWENRDTAYRFAEYAEQVFDRLGDRVLNWTTLNEPWCSAYLGHFTGLHAPGRTDARAALVAAHHLLLGHGLAASALRAKMSERHRLSIVLNLAQVRVDRDDEAHRDAARRVDGLQNRLFLEPLLHGAYPADVLADTSWVGDWDTVVQPGDTELINAPLDLLGINYYSPTRVEPAEPEFVSGGMPGLRGVRHLPPRGPLTGFDWEQEPAALRDLLVRLSKDYPEVPLMVTENGSAWADEVRPDGTVVDPERENYLLGHLRAVHEAIERGADIRGYLAWSLLDNFEWAAGYSQRFGLVHVDYETQKRTPKSSALRFASVAAANAVPAADGTP
ncbi:GH1 family beta-glucosidase [Actinoalloteichus hymeniacidonis]|uniref:Beta-glucosidase n=1 Tax=Actinoalloteichus hymeniacidonis TaxID=340345 RepID=A0AAC9HN03_9PSEU|nr:GH1 family beta-glucosidase [Actinoalloteichus hymeniacidonis]AOS62230.1 broad-specificity cellobiase [Actinoalloteichus hymeniacidonis]MBB5909744.1 beta-glucosidase [Actinoalloteichus hymeniacidonis]